VSTRALARSFLLLLASFGPLAPVMVLFLLAMPPLIALSGWPWWLNVTLAVFDCGLIIGAALWFGPGALAAAREFLDEERRK
jgi:hypothetical protein